MFSFGGDSDNEDDSNTFSEHGGLAMPADDEHDEDGDSTMHWEAQILGAMSCTRLAHRVSGNSRAMFHISLHLAFHSRHTVFYPH